VAPAAGSARPRPLLVELVGPPGAGKSTVFEGLLRDGRIEPRPILRRREPSSLAVWNLLAALVLLGRHRMLNRSMTWLLPELAYLRALPKLLDQRPPERIVVFDQGPIFFLTRPQVLVPRLARWRNSTFDTWSSLLDVIVLLEAPDDVLIERINARSKVHRMKGSTAATATEFLADHHAVFREPLERLDRAEGTTVLRFDTSSRSAEEVVEEVVARLTTLRAAR